MVLFNRYKNGTKRALTMSFDDGRQQDERLIEMFNKYGIKGTFHLNGKKFLSYSDEELRKTAAIYEGHEVSCHTLHHPHLEHMPIQLCTKEIVEDKAILEKMCGYIVRGMSYPFGTYSEDAVSAMRAGGMEYSRTVGGTLKFELPKDFLTWSPTTHYCGDLFGLLEKFNNTPWISLPVYYIWGHSYELDTHNNWDRFEDFCAKASGNPEVWYATNIEIVDYVNALRSLKFSWDRHLAYNPTVTDVWVTVEGETVKIGAGETVDLGPDATK